MKFAKLALSTLPLLLVVGCQRPYETVTHATFQDKTSFKTTVAQIELDLKNILSPVNKREEQGHIHLSLQGGNLDLQTRQKLRTQLTEYLHLPVQMTYQSDKQNQISAELEVALVPDTCRYNRQALPVSAHACQQLRNHYLSVVNKSTWRHGEEYQEHNSALTTGAVQRLFNNQLKSAERQPVTGE
ncbi:pilus assembly protein FlpD [Vibrio sp. J1-1]|uniref:pilus assembly protein FlpD n=1 Tax=Vibrio sp. J1-1 TaxID=2912251 RepID=UPI001F185EE4|nr:pilus assembly protein FlpD [Vibrio sp. J1-1]MBR9875532.1 pilus assembly protein FlpD [Vibrionaceae bacterium]MCF7482205.1 pilus assembly protein FlpD [Vibrio sp. J1-1]